VVCFEEIHQTEGRLKMINYPSCQLVENTSSPFGLLYYTYNQRLKYALKIAFGFFSTVALILLFLSGSRGGWVAGLVGIIIFATRYSNG
jgi:hypothetical protein